MKVQRAVIPVAGLARGLLPQSYAVPCSLLPVNTETGELIPMVHLLVRELIRAGVQRIALVCSPWNIQDFKGYFSGDIPEILREKAEGDPGLKVLVDEFIALAEIVDFIKQPRPLGLGHAVLQAREWVGDRKFMLVLGDHRFFSTEDTPCLKQLADASGSIEGSILGVYRHGLYPGSQRGYAAVEYGVAPENLLRVRHIEYGPDPDSARERLRHESMAEDEYMCLLGAGIFPGDVFSYLERSMTETGREKLEFAPALDSMVADGAVYAVEIQGESLEIDTAEAYGRIFSGRPDDLI